MPERRSRTSTLAVVLLALLVLAALAGFALLDRVAGDGDAAGHGKASEGGLPEGFTRLPDDLFFERVHGAQKLAGSWAIHQERERAGQLSSALDATSEIVQGGPDTVAEVQWLSGSELVRLEVRVVDSVYYVKGFPTERPWWRVDPQGSPRDLAVARHLDRLVAQTTDAEEIQPHVERVTLVGPDNLDGVAVAHYRIDMRPAREVVGPSAPEGASTVLDVWVDEADRPVRVVTEVAFGDDSIVTTSDFSRYGEDFPIEAPPAGQVTTAPPEVDVTGQ